MKRAAACLLLFTFIFALVSAAWAEETNVINTSDGIGIEETEGEPSYQQILAALFLPTMARQFTRSLP